MLRHGQSRALNTPREILRSKESQSTLRWDWPALHRAAQSYPHEQSRGIERPQQRICVADTFCPQRRQLTRYRSMQSFVAKHGEGINARRAERGNQARRERYENKQHGYRQESYQVTGTHAVDSNQVFSWGPLSSKFEFCVYRRAGEQERSPIVTL
jgi:hypothetical protein